MGAADAVGEGWAAATDGSLAAGGHKVRTYVLLDVFAKQATGWLCVSP